MEHCDILMEFISDTLNALALSKGGDPSQVLGDVLTIEEMETYTLNCIEYFGEMYGLEEESIGVRKNIGNSPQEFSMEILFE